MLARNILHVKGSDGTVKGMSITPVKDSAVSASMVPAEHVVYSIADLCALTGLSRNSIYGGIRRGQIPSLRVGARYVLPRPMIDTWLRRGSQLSAEAS